MSQFRDVDFRGGFGFTLTACFLSAVFTDVPRFLVEDRWIDTLFWKPRSNIRNAWKMRMQDRGADVAIYGSHYASVGEEAFEIDESC